MNDKTYDILKWIATVIIPAVITFLIAVFTAWNIPHIEPITATLAAINVLVGTIVQKSAKNYKQEQAE